MDKAPLVDSDLEVEGRIVSALSQERIPVTAVDWNWDSQVEEWQLTVVTSLSNTKGPREAYARILEALSLAGVYQSIPIRKLFVKSPQDPAAQRLVQDLKHVTEGSIHIVKNLGQDGHSQYSVVFAPYLGSGGAIPSKRFLGDDELRAFLEKRLGILPYVIDQTLSELGQKSSTSIFNVQLTLKRLKSLNLAA